MRALCLAALVALSLPASAQTTVGLAVGGAEFDLSGVGSAVVVDARLTHALNRYVAVEGGLGLTSTAQQFGDVTYLLPDAQLVVGVPIGDWVRPFLGVGVGAFLPVAHSDAPPVSGQSFGSYDPDPEGALTFALGAERAVYGPWGIRVAGRLRATVFGGGPDVFSSTFTEVVGGVTYRL